jgi:hypothetical protein
MHELIPPSSITVTLIKSLIQTESPENVRLMQNYVSCVTFTMQSAVYMHGAMIWYLQRPVSDAALFKKEMPIPCATFQEEIPTNVYDQML